MPSRCLLICSSHVLRPYHQRPIFYNSIQYNEYVLPRSRQRPPLVADRGILHDDLFAPRVLLFIGADVVAILTTIIITSTAIIITIVVITTAAVIIAQAAAVALAAQKMNLMTRAVGLEWLSIPDLHLHIPAHDHHRGHPLRLIQP